MHRLLTAFIAGLALGAAAVAPAAAQQYPGGSYLQSCTDIRMDGDRLSARCSAANGARHRSSIDVHGCRDGDLANVDGQLQCNRSGYGRDRNDYGRDRDHDGYRRGGNADALPGGSYRQSCSGAYVNGNRLTATCTSDNGPRITSSVDLGRCNNVDIANRNGRLDCR
jgi:hypothetical protein